MGMVIQKDQAVEVKDDETVIITSAECDESVVLVTSKSKPFGFSPFSISLADVEKIKALCVKSGFPAKFIVTSADREELCFHSHESGTDKAVTAEKVVEKGKLALKLSVVKMKVKEIEDGKSKEEKQRELEL